MGDVLVKNTGVMIPIAPHNGKDYTLVELQAYVGGNIEMVRLGDGKVLLLDEEGKLKGKLPNHKATGWIMMSGYMDWVAGDAVLIDEEHLK